MKHDNIKKMKSGKGINKSMSLMRCLKIWRKESPMLMMSHKHHHITFISLLSSGIALLILSFIFTSRWSLIVYTIESCMQRKTDLSKRGSSKIWQVIKSENKDSPFHARLDYLTTTWEYIFITNPFSLFSIPKLEHLDIILSVVVGKGV